MRVVSIPRQSRGLYELSRSKRLLGSLARPQYVGRLKAARGYLTRPVVAARTGLRREPIREGTLRPCSTAPTLSPDQQRLQQRHYRGRGPRLCRNVEQVNTAKCK